MIKDITFLLSMLGWFNGIILSFYFLFFIKEKSVANRLFGLLLLLLSVRVGKSAIWWFNPEMPIIYVQIGLGACFMIGPILYFYIQAYKNKLEVANKGMYIIIGGHLFVTILVLLFLTGKEDLFYWKKFIVYFIYTYWFVLTLFSGVQLTEEIKQLYTKVALSNDKKWILSIYFSFLLLVFTYALSFAGKTAVLYITGPLIFSLVIYLNIMLFIFRKNIKDLTTAEPKYSNKIESKIAEEVMERLNEQMDSQHSFTNSELKINDVATSLNMSVHHLSQVLNDNYDTSFNNYINQLRIEYSKKLIEEKADQFTLEAIGRESGFNSKTTFFTLFKKINGITPKEYKESMKNAQSGPKL
jgi:AraC-like DNA-binding protein